MLTIAACATVVYRESEVTKKKTYYVEHGVRDTILYRVELIVIDGDTVTNDTIRISPTKGIKKRSKRK